MGSKLFRSDGQRQRMVKTCLIDITADDDLSTAIDLEGCPLLGMLVPAMNGTPTLTPMACDTIDGTYLDLLDQDGSTSAVSIQAGASAFAVSSDYLTPLAGYRFLKWKSTVPQTSDRTLTMVLAP